MVMAFCSIFDCCGRDTTIPANDVTQRELSLNGFEQVTHNSLSVTGRVKSTGTTNTDSTTQSEDNDRKEGGKDGEDNVCLAPTESNDIGLSIDTKGSVITKSKEIELSHTQGEHYVTKLKVLEKEPEEKGNLSIGKSMTLQTGDCVIEVPVLPSPSTATTAQSLEEDIQADDQLTNPPTAAAEASPPPATTLPPLPSTPKKSLNATEQKLASTCPSATDQEICRFLTANKSSLKKAEKHLQSYLAWRKTCRLDDPPTEVGACASCSSAEDFQSCASVSVTEDENDWNCASYAALSLEKAGTGCDISSLPVLPRLARMDDVDGNQDMRDREGLRIVQLNPAMVDPNLAGEDTYANCIAFYLDRRFSRYSMEKFTLSIDIRGGDGWACPPAKSIIPFIQEMTSVIDRNFPDRLSCSLVWPLPWAAVVLWKTVKVFLDPQTAKKVVMLKAPAHRDSPPPFSQMEKYVEKSVIERMERNRTSTIVPE